MQMNVAGLRRNIKNLAHNYSDAQVKVREATSNDPWGPSSTIMAEIADLTYNVVAFSEIMSMIWKRTNDHGKNWRHVYKALLLLEYLIKTGSEKVAQQCKENIFAVQTLREFQYIEEGKDQGTHVREKAKQLVALLRDDERLKNERARSLKAKERFARTTNGFGSDGSIDEPVSRDRPAGWQDEPPRPAASDLEFVRPQTAGEEELQLQLAMAMSREEAEQEEAKRRSDDVRLQLALSQSEQDFKKDGEPIKKKPNESHLMDLLDISFGATSLSHQSASSSTADAWNSGLGATALSQPDPWTSRAVTSPPLADPWVPSKSNSVSPALKADPVGWRTNSPAAAMVTTANDSWNSGSGGAVGASTNGNSVDPWLGKAATADPWASPKPADPWAPSADLSKDFGTRLSPVGAATSPINDLDDFDIITNRSKSSMSNPAVPQNNNNSNNLLGTDDLLSTTPKKTHTKTPHSFLGENSALVNLDNLIKPATPSTTSSPAFNPFGEVAPQRNLFQQNQPPVPSINQLKQQTAFPVTLNQDPWAPSTSSTTTNNASSAQNNNVSPWMTQTQAQPATGLQPLQLSSNNPFLS